MTAASDPATSLPPRVLVRTFWSLHRAAVRMTGGHFGLTSPRAGARFGMLRLVTTGRRSGRRREAIIGYSEDGRDLVTLAMNGWGHADPAWWLNLQAHPDAMVELPDGPRAVRARVAVGAERDRLLTTLADYPGWGSDVDALVRHRSHPTAVVVLEPRDVVEVGS